MARPREFDPVQALRAAMFLFWRRTYEQTTIRELAAAMGIGLPSLYATFGSKRRLFEQAVELYMNTPEYVITLDIDRHSARDGIELMLSRASAYYSDPSRPPGCLLNNQPRLVAERVLAQQSILEFLESRRHQLPAGADLDALANFYAAILRGLSAQARDGATKTQMRRVADMAMAAWPQYDQSSSHGST